MTQQNKTAADSAIKYDSSALPPYERREWLRDMITKEYTKVNIRVPTSVQLMDKTTIYPWEDCRFSTVHSHGIQIDRLKMDPYHVEQDNYLAVLLLAGRYMLAQDGREVFLKPGEMTIYDATRPHRIYCPEGFAKVVVTIPRKMMRERLSGVESCTAAKVPNQQGVGLITSNLLTNITHQLDQIGVNAFLDLSEQTLDLLTMCFASVRPQQYLLSRSRSVSLNMVKQYVEKRLSDPDLNPEQVAIAVGLSTRYINMLFQDEETSLMRYVLKRRLDRCYRDLTKAEHAIRVSDVAFQWGFNDVAHFSRVFKQAFGATPKEILHA